MDAKQSPTPWMIEGDPASKSGFWLSVSLGGAGMPLFHMKALTGEKHGIRGDAALIVRAVNAHEALVKAVEELQEALLHEIESALGREVRPGEFPRAWHTSHSALALARQEPSP
jgi:hypothetical protein